MKKTLLTSAALLFTCLGLIAAVPTQTLQKELNSVSSEISRARTGMNVRAAAFFVDKEEYKILNAAYAAAAIFIRHDLNLFDQPVADLKATIDLLSYADYLKQVEAQDAGDPEFKAATLALLTEPENSEAYKQAKQYFKSAIQAEKDAYHAMIEEEYGSFWGAFVRLYDTMNEGLEFPLEKEYNKLKKHRSRGINKYLKFIEENGETAAENLDHLSELTHTDILVLAEKLEPVINNYDTLTNAYNIARLTGLVMELSFSNTYGSYSDIL